MAGTLLERLAISCEKYLRKELASPTPLAYQLIEGNAPTLKWKGLLTDVGEVLLPGARNMSNVIGFAHFTLEQPRPFELQVTFSRFGMRPVLSRLAYVMPLTRPVAGVVNMEGITRLFNSYKGGFTGDPDTISRLNLQRELIVSAHKLKVYTTRNGSLTVTIPKYFRIVPHNGASVLILHRLPKQGFITPNLGARDLIAFISQLEAVL